MGSRLDAAFRVLKTRGPAALAGAVGRNLLRRRLPSYAVVKPLIGGASGLEIGGPSSLFVRHGAFPLYAIAGSIDNVNFSSRTVWSGAAEAGATFHYDDNHPPGRQYILEATDLSPIRSGQYEFLLSSHTLEHLANPLRALVEWKRTLTHGGLLVLVVPDKDGTFDHRRPVTTMRHLVEDFERHTPESDLTHLPEILALHDLSRDPDAGDFEAFRARGERNIENRCLHHHVFGADLLQAIFDWLDLKPLALERAKPYHIIAAGQRG